jgi:hypothetical protein
MRYTLFLCGAAKTAKKIQDNISGEIWRHRRHRENDCTMMFRMTRVTAA